MHYVYLGVFQKLKVMSSQAAKDSRPRVLHSQADATLELLRNLSDSCQAFIRPLQSVEHEQLRQVRAEDRLHSSRSLHPINTLSAESLSTRRYRNRVYDEPNPRIAVERMTQCMCATH